MNFFFFLRKTQSIKLHSGLETYGTSSSKRFSLLKTLQLAGANSLQKTIDMLPQVCPTEHWSISMNKQISSGFNCGRILEVSKEGSAFSPHICTAEEIKNFR